MAPTPISTRFCAGLAGAIGVVGLFSTGCGPQNHRLESVIGPLAQGEVRRYEYEFDTESGLARTALDIELTKGGQCFMLANRSHLRRVLWNGNPASTVERGRWLFICGGDVGPGSLRIETEQEPLRETLAGVSVGFHQSQESGGRFTYLSSWIEECDRLGPCDPDPSRQATFAITVRHTDDELAVCPGRITQAPGVTRCEIQSPLAPTYSALALLVRSSWRPTELFSSAQASVVLYETAQGRLKDTLRPADIGPFLAWSEMFFGPLPYGRELRLVSVPTSWLGFEHPANIALREDLDTQHELYENPVLHTFMHEVIHQWAGNRTTLQSALDFAWKEGIAEYLTYVYEQDSRPPSESSKTRATWERIAVLASLFPRPLAPADPSLNPPTETLASDSYGTGPMLLLLQLEPLIGRPAILAALRDFLREPGARSIRDLQAALERAAGTSLASYFNSWVYGAGEPMWPAFKVDAKQEGTQVTVTATQETPSAVLFPCVLEVDLVGDTDRLPVRLSFPLDGSQRTVRRNLSFPATLLRTEVDPRQLLTNRKRSSP